MRIRRMQPSDVEDAVRIWSGAFPKRFAPSAPKSREMIKRMLKEDPNLCFVAVEKKWVVGFVMGSRFSGDVVSMGPIAVDRNHVRKGIGRALVERFERASRKMKYSAIILATRYLCDTGKRVCEASGFYEALGFKEVARSKEKRIYFKRI